MALTGKAGVVKLHEVRKETILSCIYLFDKERLYVSPSTMSE